MVDEEEAKLLWRDIVFDLPQNYNFRATWTGNYETMRNIYRARKNHKQREFRDFCKFIEENFPYSELITTKKGGVILANSKLIVIEGPQGSGKTTITDYIRSALSYTNLYRLCGTSDTTPTGKIKSKRYV